MANRKADEKLSVPEWFRLEAYDETRKFTLPRQWLEQVSIRIDLMNHWREIYSLDHVSPEPEKMMSLKEFQLREMLFVIHQNPIVPVDAVVKEFTDPDIDFPTVKLVSRGLRPVRAMSIVDLYMTEHLIDPIRREWLHRCNARLEKDVPYPEVEFYSALDEEVLSSMMMESSEDLTHPRSTPTQDVLARYREEISRGMRSAVHLDALLAERDFDRLAEFVNDPVDRDEALAPLTFFTVDTSVPYTEAEAAFRKLFEEKKKAAPKNSKRLDNIAFGKWCDDGVLPCIDLMMDEEIEQMLRKNQKIRITEEDLATAIYKDSRGRERRSSTCVSDTTKPIAMNLMNPQSLLFRLLLSRKTDTPENAEAKSVFTAQGL
ncbi:DUF6387 family protein [Acidicapsa ligni]|uniref:DUF6387 family protein n=1 Tax=Acidicapsa ligni TaxID=542300 RepID=UPI0021DFC703|nr:DUF6387 family protein [Acidicapsa ligni]